jgi:hypothetical protein
LSIAGCAAAGAADGFAGAFAGACAERALTEAASKRVVSGVRTVIMTQLLGCSQSADYLPKPDLRA